jgi:hypothetical protein
MLPRRASTSSPTVPLSTSSPTRGRHDGAELIDVNELQVLLVRQRISNMFRRYVPTKLHRLDIALLRYHGKEDLLLRSLVAKFGPEPSFTAEQQRLSDAVSEGVAARKAPHRRRKDRVGVDYVDPTRGQHCCDRGDDEDSSSDTACDFEPQRCTASPRASSNANGEKFQASVAAVAHHHHMRARLFEAYSAKRTIIRMHEEKERDNLHRLMITDYRHLTSTMSRRQTETMMLAQRERQLATEQQNAVRRQEEARVAWLQMQAAQLLQKMYAKYDEVAASERQERRLLLQRYNEARAKQFRHIKRLARLRDAAEVEALQHRRSVCPTCIDNGWKTPCLNPPAKC